MSLTNETGKAQSIIILNYDHKFNILPPSNLPLCGNRR